MLAFSRAVSGLKVAEQNLYVTSNNLSNVNTDGYRRQRLVQSELQTTSKGDYSVGLGVDSSTVKQIKCEYLETNYRNQLASLGEYKIEDQVYTSLQSLIGSDGSTIETSLSSLWESFNELSKEYTTSVAGTYLKENAIALVSEFDGIDDQLYKMQNELNIEVGEIVDKINDYSSQIASLNSQITRSEAGGVLSCELRDSRDSIICELADLIDIDVENYSDTCLNIRCGNGHLVVGTSTNKITVGQNTKESVFYSPVWESTGEEVKVNSGELKGILDMRGGNVAGNSASSTNGNSKDKMDIVVSIDNDLSLSSIESMRNNISLMTSVLTRQGSNYQFYSNNGTKIDGDTLKIYTDYLYGNGMIGQIEGYSGDTSSFVDFTEAVSLSCNPTQLINEYMSSNNLTLDVLKGNFEENDDMLTRIEEYEKNGGKTVLGFEQYLADEEETALLEDVENYVSGRGIDVDGLKTYIEDEMVNVSADKMEVINGLKESNSSNVLDKVDRYESFIKYREDSNKYLMVFTDQVTDPGVDLENAASMLNDIDMRLIAVTDEKSKASWMTFAEETGGNVYDIKDLATEKGAEEIALTLSRDFNSRLDGASDEDGIPSFRAGLNSLLTGIANEVNAVFRQGANTYGYRNGDVIKDEYGNDMIDEETGEKLTYNLDLFVKINEDLPLQMGNIQINPLFSDIYNMPLSLSGSTGDFQIGEMLVGLTTTDMYNSGNNYSTADEHYADFILNFAQAANESVTGYKTQDAVASAANDRRLAVSGVSMDEELSNMIKFQYNYTAASKMIGVVDEMLETIIRM